MHERVESIDSSRIMVQIFTLCSVYLCLFGIFDKMQKVGSEDHASNCYRIIKHLNGPSLTIYGPHSSLGSDCHWLMITQRPHYIKVDITKFKLSPGVLCGEIKNAEEYVAVSDGRYLLGTFCGVAANISWTLYSSMKAMMVTMKYAANPKNQSGFQATFTSVQSEDRFCPPKWVHFQSSCYFLSPIPENKNWPDARTDCLDKGADLLKISSDSENALAGISDTSRWIGLQSIRGVFRWVDNTSVTYHKFIDDKTLRYGPRQAARKCVAVEGLKWRTVNCDSVKMKYVCKKADAGTPFAPKFDYVIAGCRKIRIQWSPPSTHSGAPITEYLAQVSEFPTLSEESQNCTLNSTSTLQCLFQGLKNDTKFYVRIAARNRQGYSNPRVIALTLSGYQRHFKVDWSKEGGLQQIRVTKNKTFEYFENCKAETTTPTVLTTTKTATTQPTDTWTQITDETKPVVNNGSVLPLSMTTIVGIAVGSGLLLLLVVLLIIVLGRSVRKKIVELRLITYPQSNNRPDIQMLDPWSVLPEQVTYMEELGRGAFGTVHRAKVMSFRRAMERRKSGDVTREQIGRIVAVKVLRESSEELQTEFLREIQIMKQVGTHPNIVSLVGCWTLSEPFLLIEEYAPHGDLLHWLRKGRKRMSTLKSPRSGYGNREELASKTDTLGNNVEEGIKDGDKVPVLGTPEAKENKLHADVSIQEEITTQTNIEERNGNLKEKETGKGGLAVDCRSEHKESLPLLMNRPQSSLTRQDFAHLKQEDVQSDPGGSKAQERLSSKVRFSSFQGIQNPLEIRPIVVSRPQRKEKIESKVFGTNDDEENFLGPIDFLSFAWQISRGMQYLASKDLIHRDLAARNVLVAEGRTLKVADFGLTRQATSGAYRSRQGKMIPIKWMAPEALFSREFTVKTDVWSFGVVLWEITTMGEEPYPTVSNKDVYQLIKTGHRMAQPELCSDEMYDIMMDCWREDPDDRPTFALLTESLERLIQTDVPYLSLDSETSFPDEQKEQTSDATEREINV